MKLTIEICLENAAFFDDDGKPEQGTEASRILQRLICGWKGTPLEAGDGGRLADINGNIVGEWSVE